MRSSPASRAARTPSTPPNCSTSAASSVIVMVAGHEQGDAVLFLLAVRVEDGHRVADDRLALQLQAALAILAANLGVTRGPEPRLWATLEGPNGRAELSSG